MKGPVLADLNIHARDPVADGSLCCRCNSRTPGLIGAHSDCDFVASFEQQDFAGFVGGRDFEAETLDYLAR